MSRLPDSPPAFDLNAAHCITGLTTAAAAAQAAAQGLDASLRLLLVQRVDCLSARVGHLEQQLRLANATVSSLSASHVLKDQRIAELEERLERRRTAAQLLKAGVRERDSQLAARVREIATLQAMARTLRQAQQ